MRGPFVIRRIDQGGGYVAPPGSLGSYTHNIIAARRFETIEEARGHCCENERVVSLPESIHL